MNNPKQQIYNAVILGPSSSGKTSIATYLANKYNGQRISLDGLTANGRPMNTVVSINKATEFTKEEAGVLIRRLMIKEATIASKNHIAWFIDDIDNFIYEIMPEKLRVQTKIIVVIPTLDKIVSNVLKRNKEASVAPEERHIIHVLKQLRTFVTPYLLKPSDAQKLINTSNNYIVSNHDLIDACEHDKMHYSIDDKQTWEEDTNSVLEKYGFKSLKSKKIQYADLRSTNFGQHAVFLNNGSFSSLIKKIDDYLHIGHYG